MNTMFNRLAVKSLSAYGKLIHFRLLRRLTTIYDLENWDIAAVCDACRYDSFPDAYYRLGILYARQVDPDQALYWFERLVSVPPKYMWGYLVLGDQCESRRDYAEVLAWYERAVEQFPESDIPPGSTGWLKLEQGEPEETCGYCAAATAPQPAFSWHCYDFAKLLMQNDRPSEAIAQLKTVASLAPEIAAMHLALGDAYGAAEECLAVSDGYGRVLVLEPDNMEAARALEGSPCRQSS